MMQENHETLHINLADAQLIDGRWYKTAKAVTERCLTELESELVNNLPITDLTKFSAEISRPYGLRWDDHAETCDNVTMANMKQKVMQAERRCTVHVEMTYAFP
jgi:hypothetical protein